MVENNEYEEVETLEGVQNHEYVLEWLGSLTDCQETKEPADSKEDDEPHETNKISDSPLQQIAIPSLEELLPVLVDNDAEGNCQHEDVEEHDHNYGHEQDSSQEPDVTDEAAVGEECWYGKSIHRH